MCHVWQFPTLQKEEITLETLAKLPANLDHLNLTGGEPSLRRDLMEIVELLYPKARTLEISSNGLFAARLEPIVKKYPHIKIRFSLEGSEGTNNRIRGEKNGYTRKVNGLLRLKELGGADLGFATVIQDDNVDEVVELFRFCRQQGFELATSTLHNGFQFQKTDNIPYDRIRVAKCIEQLIEEQLRTWEIKTWFRAYLNLGLIAKVTGLKRMLPCTAATDFAFIDPWGDVYACNVRPDLIMGNLETQSWTEIMNDRLAAGIRQRVNNCTQNCWMVGSARTAMRQSGWIEAPKSTPLIWVIRNKARITWGGRIPFENDIDYSKVYRDTLVPERVSFLDQGANRKVQIKDDLHYTHLGEFINR